MEKYRGLTIKGEWLDKIFQGIKTWEIRGSSTKNIGKVYLIQSKTGLIVGECVISGCIKLSNEIYAANYNKHRVETPFKKLSYKNPYAWVIEEGTAKRYKNPVPFRSKKGAIIWINLVGQCDIDMLLEESNKI